MTPEFTIGSTSLMWSILSLIGLIVATIIASRFFLGKRTNYLIDHPEENVTSKSARNKSIGQDVFKYRGSVLTFSLAFVLAIIVLAMNFEITEKIETKDFVIEMDEDIEIEVPRTNEAPPPPPPPPPPPTVITEVTDILLEEDDIEFVDQSIEENTAVFAEPVAITEKKEETVAPPPPPPPPEPEAEDEIFRVVEEMARFPGCEDSGLSKDEKKACSDKALLKFIYDNVRYPDIARENSIEGVVIVSFVVEKNGTVSQTEVLRSPNEGLIKRGNPSDKPHE